MHESTGEQNILDIILASKENVVSDMVIDSPLSTIDRNMFQFKLNVEGNIKYQTSNRLNYKKVNWNILKEKLENHSVNTDKDGNECWNKFKDNFLFSQDEYVKKKKESLMLVDVVRT